MKIQTHFKFYAKYCSKNWFYSIGRECQVIQRACRIHQSKKKQKKTLMRGMIFQKNFEQLYLFSMAADRICTSSGKYTIFSPNGKIEDSIVYFDFN